SLQSPENYCGDTTHSGPAVSESLDSRHVQWVSDSAPERLNVKTIGEGGPAAMRVNMVILGDGYVVEDFGEGGKWEVDAERLVSDFFNQPPFKSLRSLFNVFLVEVISQECGADDSPQTDSKRTALNCTYGQRDLAHLLVCKDKGAALTAAANAPAVDILIVIVN